MDLSRDIVISNLLYVKLSHAGTVFRRQNLTSVDVRFWRLKTVSALKELNISNDRKPTT